MLNETFPVIFKHRAPTAKTTKKRPKGAAYILYVAREKDRKTASFHYIWYLRNSHFGLRK